MTLIAGIDESGRGPVIGPLIICGVLIEENKIELLKEIGVKDSKLLTPLKRSQLFNKITKMVKSYKIIKVDPPEIDAALAKDSGINLNWLEALKTAEILNFLQPDKAFIDCPSPNKIAYEGYLRRFLNNKEMDLVVEHKADVNYLPASAASILAKVTRDAEIDKIKAKYGNVGPGYQSNPITQAFIKENFDKHPEIFRKSWATWKNHDKNKKQKKLDEF